MSFSTWISNQLFSIYDSDRVFEEMDRMVLEEKSLEFQELQDGSTWQFKWVISLAGLAAGGISMTFWKSERFFVDNWKTIAVGTGIFTLAGSSLAFGCHFWFKRKVKSIRRIIHQLERTKAALKKRKQVYFSISMRIPRHRHPLILRACRLIVSAIECLVEKTQSLTDGPTWQDLYTDEIREIMMRSSENLELLRIEEIEDDEDEMDFEAVFETLISVFKLHASEYSRVVVIDFLQTSKFDSRKFRRFLETCNYLQEFTRNLESLERSALKSERQNSQLSKQQVSKNRFTIDMDVGWRQQTAMALEAILESLESESVDKSEIELALHKTLIMVGYEKVAQKSESLEKKEIKSDQQVETILIKKGNAERTDVDMVFEGVPLSEEDKIASKNAVTRDVLLDGSESRKHEANLFGELQMVLEPRRNDFAKRERVALAKFYGVEENQLEKEEEPKKEETYEGVGAGGDEEPEPYDWRKDAETSAGIHHDADNDAFLKALNLRRVDDDIIE